MNDRNYLLQTIAARNPVLVGTVGLCPVVAVCTSLKAALIMSAITIVTLVVAQLLTSLVLRLLPQWVRLGLYTLVGMLVVVPGMILVDKYSPEIMLALGIYLPLLAANPLVVRNCERESISGGVGMSLVSSLCAGIAYSLVLVVVGFIRELLGNGTVWGVRIPFIEPAQSFLMPVGGFIIIAYLASLLRVYIRRVDPELADELILNSRTNIKGSQNAKLQLRGAKYTADTAVFRAASSVPAAAYAPKKRKGLFGRKKDTGPHFEVMTFEQAEELRMGSQPSVGSTVQAEFAPMTYEDAQAAVAQVNAQSAVYSQSSANTASAASAEESYIPPESVFQTSRFDFVTLDLVQEAKATNEYERYLDAIEADRKRREKEKEGRHR